MSIERFRAVSPLIIRNLNRAGTELIGRTEGGGLVGRIENHFDAIGEKYQIAYRRFTSTLERANRLDSFRSGLISIVWDVLPIPGLAGAALNLHTAKIELDTVADMLSEAGAGVLDGVIGQTDYSDRIQRRFQPAAPSGPGPVDGAAFSSGLLDQLHELERFGNTMFRLRIRIDEIIDVAGLLTQRRPQVPVLSPVGNRHIAAFLDAWPSTWNSIQQTMSQIRELQSRLAGDARRVWADPLKGAITLEGYMWILWVAALTEHSVLDNDEIENRLERTELIGNRGVLGVDFEAWTSSNETFVAWQRARGLRQNVENAFRDFVVPDFPPPSSVYTSANPL